MRASRRAVIVAATVAVLLVVLIAARHLIVRGVLETTLSVATGYSVRIGSQTLGTHHGVLFDVHVVKNGDPVLDAQRVDVEYALRDIFPGGAHRFGFAAISIQKPVLTITRHADGTLTFNRAGGSPAGAPPPTRKAAAPYYFTARVRDGVVRLVDEAPLQPDLANQTIENVSIDASVKSDARTTARLDGVLVGRRSAGAPVVRYPLAVHSIIDVPRGIALNTVTANELPLRGVLGFLVHSKTLRFDDGLLRDVDARVYALTPKGDDFDYTLGGHADLRDGRLTVSALAHSVRDLNATFMIAGDTFSTTALHATLGGIPVRGRGAMYDVFTTPALWLGFTADADLGRMRSLFSFTAKQPLSGAAHFETVLESSISNPLIHTAFSVPHLRYDRFPVDGIAGVVDYRDSAVVIDALHGHFGGVTLALGGSVVIAPGGDQVQLALAATGAGASLPYTDLLAPDSNVRAVALFSQPPGEAFRVRGTIATVGPTRGAGTFAVTPLGVGEFGPFRFSRDDGSLLAGGFELERPISQSAGWLYTRGFRLADVRKAAALPGVQIPMLPPIAGVVDADLAAGGTPSSFGLGGTIHGRDLRVEGYALGTGSVRLGGTFKDVRMADIRVDGPLGHFGGAGAFSNGLFALDGNYDGTLQDLAQFTSDPSARGAVHGPVRATIAENRIIVQTTGAAFAGARVRGVAIDAMSGTLAIENKSLRIIAADGTIGGAHAVAADTGGPFLVSAPAIPVAALRGTGVPLQAGTLALFGVADLRGNGPSFDGAVAVENGVAAGLPINGGVDVALAGGTARVSRGVGGLGTTFADFSGRVDGIGRTGPSALAYDLAADVPIGDVESLRSTLRLPVKYLEGSFGAAVRVRGYGAQPSVAGNVTLPEGSYNGLAFRNGRAAVTLSPSALEARDGSLTVGTTHAAVSADVSVARRAFAVDVHSTDANLSDFDDYFDEAETLDGRGAVAVAFANDGRVTRTSGRVDVAGFRYRRFTFGQTDATWSQRGGTVSAALNVRGAHGALRANGTLVAAPGDPIAAVRRGTYHASVRAQQVDLATWLPPFGITAPLIGQVDASGTISGRWPRLAIGGDASLANGSIDGFAVKEGRLHASSNGSRIALSNSTLDLGFARFDISGSTGLTTVEPLALAVHVQAADIAKALATLRPKGPHYDIGGALQSEARITGTFDKPAATLGFELTSAHYASLAIPRILGNVGYDGRTISVYDAEATFAKGNILVTGSLPFALHPFGVNPGAPLSFTLGLGNLDLAPFAPFVSGPQTKLGGTVDGRLAIEGTERAPRIAGTVTLADGSYVSDFDRDAVTKANAQLTFLGTSVALQALHANVGGGTLTGNGRLDLPFPGAHTSGYSIALDAHAARVDLPAWGRGTIDGTMQLASGSPAPVLSGDLTLSNASIPILTIYRNATTVASGGSVAGGGGGFALPLDLGFDLTAHVGKKVRVQASSPYVDIGATGEVALTGTLGSPKLDGVLTATPGGVFSTYNRAFRVQQARISFNPANGVLPYIDLRAYAHVTNPDPDPTRNAVGSADITVTVRGPADELASGSGSVIQYASNPPYSQEQIVGLLLDASVFGAVNFSQQQNGTTLRGAPGESNALLPPGVTPYQAGVINFNEEAFSVLNGQLTQRFLAPVEQFFTGKFGLTDFELTVDYGGGVGYNMLKQIGHRDIYASFGQTLANPVRTTAGFTSRPDASTSVQFDYFTQNGDPAFTNNVYGTDQFLGLQRLKGIQPLSNRQGFTFSIVRKYP
ncbi:MAG TPA: translocation/assembly module TamB domain-containing protein [Candidatus Elarobacter sp.]|nr:translocation/assembly module TamB domain-containing protein [Candidatus Elarobacter sp.]